MARVFPEDIFSLTNLPTRDKDISTVLEQNLSDEWECHAFISENRITHFVIISPYIGVLILTLSDCSPEYRNFFIRDIELYRNKIIEIVAEQLKEEFRLCKGDDKLEFPIGFGCILTKISSDSYRDNSNDLIQNFVIFYDKIIEATDPVTDLEECFYDMIEDVDFGTLDDGDISLIVDSLESIQIDIFEENEDLSTNFSEESIDENSQFNSVNHEDDPYFEARGNNSLRSETEYNSSDDKTKHKGYMGEDHYSYICNYIIENSLPGDKSILASSFYNLANDFSRKFEFDMAIRLYRKALEYTKDDPSIYSNLASCYKSIGYNDTAISLYQKCLEIDSSYTMGFLRLALIYAHKRDDDQAIREFQRFLDNSFYNRDTIFSQIGNEIKSGDYSVGAVELYTIIEKHFYS